MYIIAGLGNPGREYAKTRHNVGFDVVECLADKHSAAMNKLKFHSVYGEISVNGEKTLLVKPLTYMNNSGIAIREIMSFYKVPTDHLIVIYDDIDIPLGTLRIRPSGSSGTHNGMKSIIYHLQNDKFPRIRIGMGRNPDMDLADYVLQHFSKEERDIVAPIIESAAEAVEELVKNGVNSAMQKYNIRNANNL